MNSTYITRFALPAALALTALLHSQSIAQCASPSGRFIAIGGEIRDARNGLLWQRCSVGQTWSGVGCTGGPTLFTHEQALVHARVNSGAPGWRLPDVKELASLVQSGCQSPASDTSMFPNVAQVGYWSSTPFFGPSSNAWSVNFGDGSVSTDSRSSTLNVRLVRNNAL